MKNLIKYVTGYAPEFTDNGASEGVWFIDIAIEFSIELFYELGINGIAVDSDGYIHNKLGDFYYNGHCCWFWAITNKSNKSRNFDNIGQFYLTDGETCCKLPTREKIWSDFKKAITPKLSKALKKFAKEEGLIRKVK